MVGAGRLFVGLGVLLVIVGLLLWAGERFLGRGGGFLPGDIVIRRGNFTIAFPIVTCIVVSIVLTVLLRLFGGMNGPR